MSAGTTLCIAVCLIVLIRLATSSLEPESFVVRCTRKLEEFLVIFGLAALLFCALEFYAHSLDAETVAAGQLRYLQSVFRHWRELLERFNPSAVLSLLLAFALCLLARFSRIVRISKAFSFWNGARNWLDRAAMLLAALVSFTFFSSSLASSERTLEARLQLLDGEEARFERVLQQTAARVDVITRLEAASRTSPAPVRAIANRELSITGRSKDLIAQYHEFKDKYPDAVRAGRNPDLTAFETRVHEQEEISVPAGATTAAPISETVEPRVPAQDSATQSSMREDAAELDRYQNSLVEREAKDFESLLGERLPGPLVSAVASTDRIPLLKELSSAYPLLDPLISVLRDPLTENVSEKLQQWIQRLRTRGTRPVAATMDEALSIEAATTHIDWGSAGEQIAIADKQSRLELGRLEAAGAKMRDLEQQARQAMRSDNAKLARSLRAEWDRENGIIRIEATRRYDLRETDGATPLSTATTSPATAPPDGALHSGAFGTLSLPENSFRTQEPDPLAMILKHAETFEPLAARAELLEAQKVIASDLSPSRKEYELWNVVSGVPIDLNPAHLDTENSLSAFDLPQNEFSSPHNLFGEPLTSQQIIAEHRKTWETKISPEAGFGGLHVHERPGEIEVRRERPDFPEVRPRPRPFEGFHPIP